MKKTNKFDRAEDSQKGVGGANSLHDQQHKARQDHQSVHTERGPGMGGSYRGVNSDLLDRLTCFVASWSSCTGPFQISSGKSPQHKLHEHIQLNAKCSTVLRSRKLCVVRLWREMIICEDSQQTKLRETCTTLLRMKKRSQTSVSVMYITWL